MLYDLSLFPQISNQPNADISLKLPLSAIKSVLEIIIPYGEIINKGITALLLQAKGKTINANPEFTLSTQSSAYNHNKQNLPSSVSVSQQFIQAIKSGNINAVQTAIDAGADVKALLFAGYFPQFITYKQGESVNPFSLESLSRFNQAQPKISETLLYFATRLGKLTVVNCLLRNGAEINQAGNYGLTALIAAITEGHAEISLRLLDLPTINVNHRIQDGSTALIFACEKGQDTIVKTLVTKKADINQADEEGETPLIVAIIHNRTQLVPFLLQSGANPNKNKANNTSALFCSTR